MGISFANILIILFIVLILFGAGKLPKVMGDLGRGIKSFKDSLKDKETPDAPKEPALLKEEKKDTNKKNK